MREIDNMTGEQLETLQLKGMLPERRVQPLPLIKDKLRWATAYGNVHLTLEELEMFVRHAAVAQSVLDESKDGLDRSEWRKRVSRIPEPSESDNPEWILTEIAKAVEAHTGRLAEALRNLAQTIECEPKGSPNISAAIQESYNALAAWEEAK